MESESLVVSVAKTLQEKLGLKKKASLAILRSFKNMNCLDINL